MASALTTGDVDGPAQPGTGLSCLRPHTKPRSSVYFALHLQSFQDTTEQKKCEVQRIALGRDIVWKPIYILGWVQKCNADASRVYGPNVQLSISYQVIDGGRRNKLKVAQSGSIRPTFLDRVRLVRQANRRTGAPKRSSSCRPGSTSFTLRSGNQRW